MKISDIKFATYQEVPITAVRHQAGFMDIIDYFYSRTQGQRMPRRSDVSPNQLRLHLPRIFMWDLVRDESGQISDVRSRLMGTGIASFYGEHTGDSNFFDVKEDVGQRIRWATSKLDAYREPYAYQTQGELADDQQVELSALIVPMINSDEMIIDQCFGALDLALVDAPKGYLASRGLSNPLAAPLSAGAVAGLQVQLSAQSGSLVMNK